MFILENIHARQITNPIQLGHVQVWGQILRLKLPGDRFGKPLLSVLVKRQLGKIFDRTRVRQCPVTVKDGNLMSINQFRQAMALMLRVERPRQTYRTE